MKKDNELMDYYKKLIKSADDLYNTIAYIDKYYRESLDDPKFFNEYLNATFKNRIKYLQFIGCPMSNEEKHIWIKLCNHKED